ncbi:DUF3244 domain-containing protein [Proteiniphilum sp. X52]|uniref:DUF3244 domain-containing protein n=1 Tax=Proteiniphilum sp. X52 TaxID=2382159 RepID=UPI000F09F1C3|nr:DUF3244 domain-containing protein [Proteiniphilum sp. X52]RNC63883.1 DUF3244 domain-containing protein [Proteiniphilum sp. X52]
MKHSFFLLVFAGILFIPVSLGTTSHAVDNEITATQSSSSIDLYGSFIKRGLRSGTDPIIVELQDKILTVLFQNDVGVLYLTIRGSQGIVYDTSVDTSTPSTLTISLVNLPSGIYTIVFSNPSGTMQGNITI